MEYITMKYNKIINTNDIYNYIKPDHDASCLLLTSSEKYAIILERRKKHHEKLKQKKQKMRKNKRF